MMDGRRERKTRSHEKIVQAASKMLRAHGVSGISVDKVMEGAGLTRGGFYAHFQNKDELVATALDRAFADQRKMLLDAAEPKTGKAFLEAVVSCYLSRTHLEHPNQGCPLPPLAAEVARSGPITRAVFQRNIDQLLDLFQKRTGLARDALLSILATCVGAMTMARAVGDRALADEILRDVREEILGEYSKRARTRA